MKNRKNIILVGTLIFTTVIGFLCVTIWLARLAQQNSEAIRYGHTVRTNMVTPTALPITKEQIQVEESVVITLEPIIITGSAKPKRK